jgi:AraC-like DNA-binding protein
MRYNMEDSDAYCITYERLPHEIHMPVRSVYVDKERALWFGTKGDGLYRIRDFEAQTIFDSDNVQKFDTKNSRLSNNNIYAITEESHGFILLGSDGNGLNYWSYDNRHIGKVRGSDKLKRVHSIVEENDSTLWVSTDGTGAFRCTYRIQNGAPVMTEVVSQELCEPFNEWANLFSSTIPNDSTIWFGSRQNGVLEYNSKSGKSRVIQFPTSSGLAVNETFYITSADEMLIATGNGLVIYSPEDRSFHQSDHISKRATHGIVCDNRKNIWVSNNSGIISLDSTYNYRLSFNTFSGLDVLEYSDGACFYDEPGNLVIFGGINGITIIRNNGNGMLSRQEYCPNIYVTHFIQNDKEKPIHPMMEKGKLKIPYSKSIFGIKFSLVDHLHYPDYEFRYNIEGYNSEWVTNKSDIIYIHSLEPGDYNLKIAYINKATGYRSKECVLPVHILPPFYRTWWAYCIYSLLIIGIIYIAVQQIQHKYRTMKEKIRQKYLDELNNISHNTTSTINEELSVQLTFIIGLCQQIRQAAQNSPYMADKVNLVEYNIAKINKTLHMFNEYKGISEAMINSAEATFIPVSQTAAEILDLMRGSTKVRNVSLTYHIEEGITTALNKEAFLTMLYSLVYKAISIAKGQKKVDIKIERGEEDGVTVKIVLTTDNNITEEEGGDFLLCSRLVEVMNGHISMDFDENTQKLRIEVNLPSIKIGQEVRAVEDIDPLMTESINTYNTIIENQLPKNFKNDIHPYYIYIISSNRDISSFIGYFLSDSYNVRSFTDNISAVERIEQKVPVAVIYDVSSMNNGLTDFLEAVKGSRKMEQIMIVALTSSLQTTEREEYAKLGADMCISFPFNMNYLRTALEKLQQKQKNVSEYYKSPRGTFTIDEGKVIHNEDKDFMDKILKTIEENISNPELTAPMIADLVGISTRVMYRRMESITEKKLHQIIREARMSMAVTLLSSSKLNIDEIMYKVGYDNRSTFYRNFKDIYDKTPREYREQMHRDMIRDLTK